MTAADMMQRVWEALGEPGNMDPATDISYNGGPVLLWYVNEGQREVAKWKDPQSGKPVRIHDLNSVVPYKSCVIEAAITAVNNTTSPYSITVDTVGTEADRYNDWVVEITSGDADGEKRYIVDSDTGVLYVDSVFTADPAVADTVKLYKRFDLLLPSTHAWAAEHIALPAVSDLARNTGNLLEVLSIVDIKNKTELESVNDAERFPAGMTDTGNPNKWYRYGNAVYYDKNVDTDDLWLRMEYYRTPLDMDLTTNTEPDIPEIFHMAIVLWATWWGYKMTLESSKAYSTKLDLESEMKRTTSQFDIRKSRLNLGGSVKYDG
jgi:hypothetical protein